jgi:hypothetical protein
MKKKSVTKKKLRSPVAEQIDDVSVRSNITFPKDMWDIIGTAAKTARPKLSANQLTIMLLDYAIKNELPKIQWIFRYLPQDEKEKIKKFSTVSR